MWTQDATGRSPADRRRQLQRLIAERRLSRDQIRGRAAASDTVPVSPTQERIWFGEKFNPNRAFYHLPATLRLRGPLNIEALEYALAAITRRHDALRAVYYEVDGFPVQRDGGAWGNPLRLVDVSAEADPQTQAERLVSEDILAPFDLEIGPPWRALLVRVGPDDHVLVLTFHHIIFDDASFGIFGRELAEFYKEFCTGQPAALSMLTADYADFAVWQRERLTTSVHTRLAEYWRSELNGAPRLVDLVSDRPRPPTRNRSGRFYRPRITRKVVDQTKALAREEGTTAFTVLLTVFGILLSRYSRQSELIVASTTIGRARPELENLIGCFVDILCLRLDMHGDPTFREALSRVRQTTIDAYSHQEMPFEELVRELAPQRSSSHAPLFQVGLGMRESDGSVLRLPGVEIDDFPIGVEVSHFDLMVDLTDNGAGIEGLWGYNDDLFDESTISRMARHFELLAAEATAFPDRRIAGLALPVSDTRPNGALNLRDAGRRLHDLVTERAQRHPDAPAVSMAGPAGGETLTYAKLTSRAARTARVLRERGAAPGAPVVVLAERGPRAVVATLAALMAGGVSTLLDPAWPAEHITAVLRGLDSPFLLTERLVADRLGLSGPRCVYLDNEPGQAALEAPVLPPVGPACVLYDLDALGEPKSITLTHADIVGALTAVGATIGIQPSDALLAVTPAGYDFGALEPFLALAHGARLVIAPTDRLSDGPSLRELIEAEKPTIMQATPATWKLLLDDGWPGRPGLTALCHGGLPHPVARRLASRTRLWSVYGMPMTGVWSMMHPVSPAAPPSRGWLAGTPLASTRVRMLDDRGKPVPTGAPGQVHVGGEHLVPTGDLARVRSDGTVEILGRLDQQLRADGYRINPTEVEMALTAHPGVREAAVVPRRPADADQLIAYLGGEAGLAPDEVEHSLKDVLPEYMMPVAFVVMDALPRHHLSGRIDRAALSRDEGRQAFLDTDRNPVEGTEAIIAGIWCELLNVDGIAATDNFWHVGGQSLTLTRLRLRLESRFGIGLPLTDLIRHTTVRAQARLVDQLRVVSSD